MSPRSLLLSSLTSLTLATPALAGPPWISIELPPNPFDPATRGAAFVVKTFHYRNDGTHPLTGRAIGIVEGQRRTATVRFDRTSREGVFAVPNTWGGTGIWSVVVTANPEHGDAVEALVKISSGRVVGVEVATSPGPVGELPMVPRRFTDQEIEASLRGRG